MFTENKYTRILTVIGCLGFTMFSFCAKEEFLTSRTTEENQKRQCQDFEKEIADNVARSMLKYDSAILSMSDAEVASYFEKKDREEMFLKEMLYRDFYDEQAQKISKLNIRIAEINRKEREEFKTLTNEELTELAGLNSRLYEEENAQPHRYCMKVDYNKLAREVKELSASKLMSISRNYSSEQANAEDEYNAEENKK